MIRNYLNVAFRNLINNKVFSVINVVGLSIGLACAVLIALWVIDELKQDQFHKKEIYHVLVNAKSDEEPLIWMNTPAMTARIFKENIAGVEHAIKVSGSPGNLFFIDDRKFSEVGYFADSAFFEVFDYPIIAGDRKSALYGMNVVAVSDELAIRLYGTTDVVGKTVEIQDLERESYTITAIFQVPNSSSQDFDFVAPYHKYRIGRQALESPGNFNDYTYVTLVDNQDKTLVENEFSDFIYEMFQDERDIRNSFYLYPYKDLYLKSNFEKWPFVTGRIQYVKLFIIIGFVILIIACINFMNLSTAQAAKRAKEVGVRKTIGARKGSLVAQFLGESLLITFIALLLALTIADLLMPVFNVTTGKQLSIPFGDFYFILTAIGILLLTGLISGSYPALYLSSFEAATVLKGEVKKGRSLIGIRKFLVVFQFVLSITLIICTIVIYKQMDFIGKKDLGVDRENIIMHWMASIGNQREAYRNELLQIPGVESVNMANFNPMMIYNSTNSVDWRGKTEEDDFYFHVMTSDRHFTKTFNANLIKGQDLPDNLSKEDTMSYFLLNETAVKMMGLNDPIGAQIAVWGNPGTVVGVVKDFNHDNLYQPIEPVVVFRTMTGGSRCFIKLSGTNTSETVAAVKRTYEKFENDQAFSYLFLNDEFNKMYKNVQTVRVLSTIFAVIAILISCLGLFGLSSYMSEQRKKETGIRKVMGASVADLTILFSRDFVKLVFLSFVIACPVAWYLTSDWLKDFAYRINPSIWIFLIAGIIALVIALLTVSYHTIRTSLSNPINSLKYE